MRIAVGGMVGILAAWMGAGAGAAWAQTPVAPPPAAAATVPAPDPTPSDAAGPAESLKLAQDTTLRLTLAVKVNGQGPFDFLVDTGSNRTVISRELAATLALPPGRKVLMHESVGQDEVTTVVIDHLAIGNRVIDHIEAPALAAKDLGAVGMLGVDALRNLHVVMDFKAMRMSSSASRAETFDSHTIVIRGHNHLGQLILVNAKIRGVPISVIVDSGAQLSIGNPALLKLLTGRAASRAPPATAEIISVTGRKMTVELDQIAEAQVGGILIRNMPLAFAQLPLFDHIGLTNDPALLLGMDVLSLCQRVSVDLRRREATFTLN
jgi:predicted aspartyl protease